MTEETTIITNENEIAVNWCEVTPVGLRFIDTPPSYEEWEQQVATWGRIHRASRWALGDLLNLGETNFGEKYSQAMELTDLTYGTLANYKYVAAHFPIDRRWEDLPISFHMAVLPLESKEQQDRLLQEAHDKQMNREEFRLLVRQYRSLGGGQEGPIEHRPSVAELTLRGLVIQYIRAIQKGDIGKEEEYFDMLYMMVENELHDGSDNHN